MSTLIDYLNDLATKLNTVPDLNSGGCCVVAAHVAKRLQHIIPTRIVVFSSMYENPSLDKIRDTLTNTHSGIEWANEIDFFHVMVEFEYEGSTYLFDSTGVVQNTDSITLFDCSAGKAEGYLLIEEACALAANRLVWNSQFDRSYIPSLRKRVSKSFEKINTIRARTQE